MEAMDPAMAAPGHAEPTPCGLDGSEGSSARTGAPEEERTIIESSLRSAEVTTGESSTMSPDLLLPIGEERQGAFSNSHGRTRTILDRSGPERGDRWTKPSGTISWGGT
jgi:hypothetical protein